MSNSPPVKLASSADVVAEQASTNGKEKKRIIKMLSQSEVEIDGECYRTIYVGTSHYWEGRFRRRAPNTEEIDAEVSRQSDELMAKFLRGEIAVTCQWRDSMPHFCYDYSDDRMWHLLYRLLDGNLPAPAWRGFVKGADHTAEVIALVRQHLQDKEDAKDDNLKRQRERAAKIAEAKQTGQRIELETYSCECHEPDCSLDIVTVYAMPDGTTKTDRQHTW